MQLQKRLLAGLIFFGAYSIFITAGKGPNEKHDNKLCIITQMQQAAKNQAGLSLSPEHIEQNAPIIIKALKKLLPHQQAEKYGLIIEWVKQEQKRHKKHAHLRTRVTGLIMKIANKNNLILSPEYIEKYGQETIAQIIDPTKRAPGTNQQNFVNTIIMPWIKQIKLKLSNSSLTSTFEKKSAQKPWKTAREAAAIAHGLETTLHQLLAPHLSYDEITHLQEKNLSKHKIAWTKTLTQHATIPANAHLFIIGDLHGDFGPIHALLNLLTKQNRFNPETGQFLGDTYVAFLGDIIDRGKKSLKNLWYLWQLKKINPDRVFIVRGNHESPGIFKTNGFFKDLANTAQGTIETKKKQGTALSQDFAKAFALLPTVILIDRKGSEHHRIALVHGGINPTDSTPLLAGNAPYYLANSNAHIYTWSDMMDQGNITTSEKNTSRGYGYRLSKKDVQQWMNLNNVKTIFHGHDQKERTYVDAENKQLRLFRDTCVLGVGARWEHTTFVLPIAPNTTVYNKPKSGKTQYYDDYGVIACIKPESEDITSDTTPTDHTHATNTKPLAITTLPGYILEPHYFLPLHPQTLVPNHEILQERPQALYQADSNEKIAW